MFSSCHDLPSLFHYKFPWSCLPISIIFQCSLYHFVGFQCLTPAWLFSKPYIWESLGMKSKVPPKQARSSIILGDLLFHSSKWDLMHLDQLWEQLFSFCLSISSKVSELILTLIKLTNKDLPFHCLFCEPFRPEASRGHFPSQLSLRAGTIPFSSLKPIVFHEVDTINVWCSRQKQGNMLQGFRKNLLLLYQRLVIHCD